MWSKPIQKFGAKSAWAVALFATWALYLTIVVTTDLWSYVGVPHHGYFFRDFAGVLSAADCTNLGYDVYSENLCQVFEYPGIWLWLGKTGLGRPDALWLGAVIDIAFAMLVVRLINPKDLWQFIIGTLVVLSPHVTFAMERCNVDLIIFCLLSCAALLVSKRKGFPYYLGIITSFFATLLKIYPVITLLMAALMADSKRRLMTATAIASLLITSWLLFSAVLRYYFAAWAEEPYVSGGMLLFLYLGIQRHMFFLSVGLALIALAVAIRLAMELDVKATVIDAHRSLVSHYYFGLSVTSFAFLATINYDYRWIFNIFTLPWLFLLKRNTGSNRGIRRMVGVCVALMIAWMWSNALIRDVLHVLSKLLLPHGLSHQRLLYGVANLLYVAKQLSAWSFLTVLAAIGIKTFMIEGTYVPAMFNRFVGRAFGQMASGFKSSDALSNKDVGNNGGATSK